MVGWHHQLNGQELEQTPGDGGGQGSLACCSPWRHKELDNLATKQQSFGKKKHKTKPQTTYACWVSSDDLPIVYRLYCFPR